MMNDSKHDRLDLDKARKQAETMLRHADLMARLDDTDTATALRWGAHTILELIGMIEKHVPLTSCYRVVVVYDDPRGGIWRGPWETMDAARERLIIEKSRVHGVAHIEKMW
jgi:hypothetical protein